jgi:hypothetical protein
MDAPIAKSPPRLGDVDDRSTQGHGLLDPAPGGWR